MTWSDESRKDEVFETPAQVGREPLSGTDH